MPPQSPGSNRWSIYTCICCMLVMGCTSFIFYPRWQKKGTEAAISYDVAGYYWYLPTFFIYHDIKKQAFKNDIINRYTPTPEFMQCDLLPNGNYVMKYPAGMAVMYLPFFTAAHIYAHFAGYRTDGFSLPYQLGIQLGGFLIAMLGLWYLRKLLLIFYEDRVVAVTLLLLVIGTNYLNYSVVDAGMSHTWLFTLYVFLLLNTIHFHKTYRKKYAVRIGLIIGLASLARPTEAISCLIPLLWGMERINSPSIKKQFSLLLTKFRLLLIAVVCSIFVVSIQFIYWKYISGHWVVYSYGNQHLYFRSPSFFKYTFSYDTGWLLYTPMMVLAFIGLIPFLKNGKNRVALTTFFLLNYYVVCCWSTWWYGGRAMVQSYPVLLFPVASLVAVAFNRKALAWILTPFILLFAYLNIWLIVQYHGGGLYDNTNMTGDYYWHVVGRWHVPFNYVLFKDNVELFDGRQVNKVLIYQNDFEQDTSGLCKGRPISGLKSLELNDSTRYAIEYKFPFSGNNTQWLEVNSDFRCGIRENVTWFMSQFIISTYKKGQLQRRREARVQRLMVADNEQINFSMFMNIENQSYDSVGVSFWNGAGKQKMWVDNVKVYTFDEGPKKK